MKSWERDALIHKVEQRATQLGEASIADRSELPPLIEFEVDPQTLKQVSRALLCAAPSLATAPFLAASALDEHRLAMHWQTTNPYLLDLARRTTPGPSIEQRLESMEKKLHRVQVAVSELLLALETE